MNTDRYTLDDQTLALLQQYGFDYIPFSDLVKRLKAGSLSAKANRLEGPLELPGDET